MFLIPETDLVNGGSAAARDAASDDAEQPAQETRDALQNQHSDLSLECRGLHSSVLWKKEDSSARNKTIEHSLQGEHGILCRTRTAKKPWMPSSPFQSSVEKKANQYHTQTNAHEPMPTLLCRIRSTV